MLQKGRWRLDIVGVQSSEILNSQSLIAEVN